MRIFSSVGSFAGDKDAAAHIRESYIVRQLRLGNEVLLDFRGVELATQSFIHALIASTVRDSPEALDSIEFRHCNDEVRGVIQIVVEYAQDDLGLV